MSRALGQGAPARRADPRAGVRSPRPGCHRQCGRRPDADDAAEPQLGQPHRSLSPPGASGGSVSCAGRVSRCLWWSPCRRASGRAGAGASSRGRIRAPTRRRSRLLLRSEAGLRGLGYVRSREPGSGTSPAAYALDAADRRDGAGERARGRPQARPDRRAAEHAVVRGSRDRAPARCRCSRAGASASPPPPRSGCSRAALSFVDGRLIPFTASVTVAGLAASFLLGNLRDAAQARLGLADRARRLGDRRLQRPRATPPATSSSRPSCSRSSGSPASPCASAPSRPRPQRSAPPRPSASARRPPASRSPRNAPASRASCTTSSRTRSA